MMNIPLKWVWLGIFLVCAALFGAGQLALEDAIAAQGVSASGIAWMAGVAFLTLPAVVGIAVIFSVVDSGMSPVAKWFAAAATIYATGFVSAALMGATTAIDFANTLTCPSGAPGLIMCGIVRGLTMFTEAYTWQFLLAGVLIYGGLAYSAMQGVVWLESSALGERMASRWGRTQTESSEQGESDR